MLLHEETGTTIHVFGVEHNAPQPHIGEWIIRNRPQAVVVETSLGPEHGAMPGNVIGCKDQVVDKDADFYLRMFCQVGAALVEFKDADFTTAPLWKQVRSAYNGEQLAYIGAFAAGVPLVYGDRPKDITYRRLFTIPTITQLDEAVSYQAEANYRSLLTLPPPPYVPEQLPLAEQIVMVEREAVMLKVVHDLCRNALAQQPLPGGKPESIALVLGSGHLQGISHLWSSGRWKELLGGANCVLPASDLMAAPPLPSPESKDYGLRRGLMEAVLRLSVTQEVLRNLEVVLGPVPDNHQTAVTALGEVYNCPRMQLASLPRDMLQAAVVGFGCDFYEELQVMRDIRPMHGGPGYSEEMVTYVRALNFELD